MAAARAEGCVTAKRATHAAGQLEGIHKQRAHRPAADMRRANHKSNFFLVNLTNQAALALQLMGRRAAI